jgi:hypothetical protein
LFGAEHFEIFFKLGLGVLLDLPGRSFEAFGLRLPRIQLLFHQRLIIFPNSHDLSPAIGLTFISVIAISILWVVRQCWRMPSALATNARLGHPDSSAFGAAPPQCVRDALAIP